MATPTGPRADSARQWFARERRRKKQDQKAFDIAGLVAAPHDFGSAGSSAAFPNALSLPASIQPAVEVLAASGAIPAGDTLFDDGITQARNAEDMANLTVLHAVFRGSRSLTITRGAAVATGTLQVYFWGPKGQRILIGTGTLT
jgi:hypothetical protein